MLYTLSLKKVEQGTGFYQCQPNLGIAELFDYVQNNPKDWFAHKYLLEKLQELSLDELKQTLANLPHSELKQTLGFELSLLRDDFNTSWTAKFSPLPLIKIASLPNSTQKWLNYLQQRQNRPNPQVELPQAPLPKLESKQSLTHPFSGPRFEPRGDVLPVDFRFFQTTYSRLQGLKIFKSSEYRHANGLAPLNLWRKWRFERKINTRFLDYTLKGEQTSFGRGLNLDQAKIRLYMEMVERFSAYAQVEQEQVVSLRANPKLIYGSYSQLASRYRLSFFNFFAIDPDYQNEPLFWIQGIEAGPDGYVPILVPAQNVFLFFNPGEVCLTLNQNSTGLAAGQTTSQARLSGLLEAIERDSLSLSLFDEQKIFAVDFTGSSLEGFSHNLKQKHVYVYFQDLSSVHQVPCFKAFVQVKDELIWGSAAHLNSYQALVNALTEIAYDPASGPTQKLDVPIRHWTEFPNFSTQDPQKDLSLLERHLLNNKLRPIYVELTHAKLQVPVWRTLVPGLETLAEFDLDSRLSPRLAQILLDDLKRSEHAG